MWPLFKVISLVFFLLSTNMWAAFYLPTNYIPLIACIFMLMCVMFGKLKLQNTNRAFAILGVLVIYVIYAFFILGSSYGILVFVSYLPALLLYMLPKERQQDLLDFVTKWMGIIMGVSLTFFLIGQVVELPNIVLKSELLKNYSTLHNYFFYVKADMYESSVIDVIRFSGPFIEPGHQSMICAFLLFANRFEFKQRPILWVLLLSVVFSFSLAGYVILVIGLMMIKMKNFSSMVGVITVLVSIWAVCAYGWNGGENPVNKLIFERLEFDDQKGIKGNNRTIKQTDYYFRQCVDDGTIWLGVRSQKEDKMKIRGAGYKIFLLRYGIIGAILTAVIYLLLINPKANKRYAYSFFALVLFAFLQRSYPTWFSWLLPYVCGIGITRGEKFGAHLPEMHLRKRRHRKRLQKQLQQSQPVAQ